jgi:2-phosphosulfolactate phosphatase
VLTPTSGIYDQAGYAVCFDWGESGARSLTATAEVCVVVDVLSFSTAVDIAIARGAVVYPSSGMDAADLAAQVGAEFAVLRRQVSAGSPYSLSPASLMAVAPDTRLVLTSPNGATITLMAAEAGKPVLAGCLRNAATVAGAARKLGQRVAVIAAGERWPDGSLRPALEDLLGAGAIIEHLGTQRCSPEAEAAAAAFRAARTDLRQRLRSCASGRELIAAGYPQDVELAAELDVSDAVPLFRDGGFAAVAGMVSAATWTGY